ncbi:hypothetical protein SKAU_G00401510 [Synaphobranchus kaupii]|uniref:Uncharacterized protein n=1 Tax=Synaphobranchus kaupii TaxID=118154 RepID=A0A9Q1E945_SYNKA|nr:hypothetical protein SKAU_G00401510 [Synaphobranchus kaupii]
MAVLHLTAAWWMYCRQKVMERRYTATWLSAELAIKLNLICCPREGHQPSQEIDRSSKCMGRGRIDPTRRSSGKHCRTTRTLGKEAKMVRA